MFDLAFTATRLEELHDPELYMPDEDACKSTEPLLEPLAD